LVTSTTTPETWLISRLEAALSDATADGEHIDLPKFQRSVVWSEKKQRDLIQSLLEGYPVGSLLLYERVGPASRKTYLLVDGLQRTTAIQNYLLEPLTYMTADAVDPDLLRAVHVAVQKLANLPEIDEDRVNGRIEVWMRTTKTLEQTKGFSGHRLAKELAEEFAPAATEDERELLTNAANALVDEMGKQSDIRGLALPAIVYRGREDALPDIFERINSLGTTLSKYEIFAASWVDQETTVANALIQDAIAKRYQDYIDKGFRVHGIADDGSISDYSLFDYLFGLGKLLGQKYPLLFGESEDATATQSVAFTLAAVAHGLKLSEMKALPSKMYRDAGNRIDPSLFEEALLDASDFVNATLKPYIGIRLNKSSGGPLIVHTEYQIVSMICRTLAARFVPRTWEERDGWAAEIDALGKTLPQYYLFDLLEQNWRGAGDTRLFNRTWRVSEASGSLSPAGTYLEPISQESWDSALRGYFEDQVVRVQRMRSHVRAIDKLFLKFVYSGIVSYKEEMQKSFEIDHLLPVSRLVQMISDDSDGWPISHVGNLALFESDLNREKTKYTIPEYLTVAGDSPDAKAKNKVIERYLLCEQSECGIPQADGQDAMTRDQYISFLRSRFSRMAARVAESIGLEGFDLSFGTEGGSEAS
jgi:hypothetical protein